ncbi:MAG: enoyl-ACP reductase FabI [Limnochordia bacterium]|nr:enoyl-ACP reductase [Bacillota bacterium]NLL09202.1 enoyl-ACP reductase [Bacillota bacterium]HBG09851.1 NADH-specific enoyl-ACP reductase [Bacillota bacterium]
MLLEGKRIAIFNVANKRSIAWAIAKAMDAQGAELVLGYQNERTKDAVQGLAQELTKMPAAVVPCDVAFPEQIEALQETVGESVGTIHGLVHSLAYAPKNCLHHPFLFTEREDFLTTLEISTYSLVALARVFTPLFAHEASVITLTYLGSEKVLPNYNVMGVAKAALEASVRYLAHDLGPAGVRVNAISAGPINTVAARGISGFLDMLDLHQKKAPLGRNVEAREVADAAVFLASDLASGITGEVIHVDTGYHIVGV